MTVKYIQYNVRGDMVADNVQQLFNDWTRLVAANANVKLNLADVEKMDSSGLGAVMFLYKRLSAAQKRVEIINASGQPLEYLSKLDIASILAAAPNSAEQPSVQPVGSARWARAERALRTIRVATLGRMRTFSRAVNRTSKAS
ncbi:MAG: STAS domain-containing protein [Neomegalonema sp.]|nr:STAS domain-containing protein [Neomegalonema sp.]